MRASTSVWTAFCALAGWGIILAFLLDTYLAVFGVLKLPRLLTRITDALFWIILLPLTFLVLFLVNGGEFRTYVLLAWGAGAVLYLKVRPKFYPFIWGMLRVRKKH